MEFVNCKTKFLELAVLSDVQVTGLLVSNPALELFLDVPAYIDGKASTDQWIPHPLASVTNRHGSVKSSCLARTYFAT